ncbi:L-aspartate oxidase [Scopulibacillus daqui]|uniref:L-aspartate oxidase n=1 Tax=Scopulibacillus daqui TaxID=1469162 RepID=A0ABS2Q1L8_9BACL|nr:L-aspartate oxidase [Scopulibacillus daqui]MBM7646103.1 L-aspartate oxidase [Scopulibacillus daqui]
MKTCQTNTLIVGSGLSALAAAHQLNSRQHVILITKCEERDSNSYMAQGGIAATAPEGDDWLAHFEDTLKAGHNYNSPESTSFMIRQSRPIIDWLLSIGAPFDRDDSGGIHLTREGGHRVSRILHAGGDATGAYLINHMLSLLDSLEIHTNTQAMDLLVDGGRCFGLWARDEHNDIVIYLANQVIIATGGCGQVYAPTTNNPSVTGDGLAMAYRAGAALVDMEFVQFHPTLLSKDGQAFGLVSEAVRGEGAKLVNQKGKHIMSGVHELEDLAPRDIVARTLYQAKMSGDDIYLDITKVNGFENRFPTITKLCQQADIDLSKGLIPVSPGAHFLMGGIKTDLYGRTNIKGLYACGEAACTGVHGANRLASHSLLEGITFALNVAEAIRRESAVQNQEPPRMIENKVDIDCPEKAAIQQFMFENAGIIRHQEGLETLIHWFEDHLPQGLDTMVGQPSKAAMERINLLTVGWLIATSALQRTESRGSHFRSDYPEKNDKEWLEQKIVKERRAVESY